MSDLKALLRQQVEAIRVVERALDNFKKIGKTKLTVAIVQNRLERLRESFVECTYLHKEINAIATEAERTSLDYFTKDRFLAAHEIYLDTSDFFAETSSRLKAAGTSGNSSSHSETEAVHQPCDVADRLPPLLLPQFSGAISEWESFRDRFSAMIIARKGLSNVSRFQYLLSSLQGEAADLVTNIAITDAGFELAWDRLVGRYENTRLLVTTHLNTLYDLPQVRSESAEQLQHLRDKTSMAINALRNLKRPIEHWDDILVFFVTKKLDPASRKAWELQLGNNTQCPTFRDLDFFLRSRTRALQSIMSSTSESVARRAEISTTKSNRSRATSLHAAASAKGNCELCNTNHTLSQCSSFKTKSAQQRFDFVKSTNRCVNCLSPTHATRKCASPYNCNICKKRHHTLLHFHASVTSSGETTSATNVDSSSSNVDIPVTTTLASCFIPRITATQQALLATARVELRSPSGRSEKIRALLDQGSVVSIISEDLTQRLRIPRSRISACITGIGNAATSCRSLATFTIASCKNESAYPMTAYVLRSLSSYIPTRINADAKLSHIRDLDLADENPFSSDPIELIIGADQYGSLLLNGLRKGTTNQPTAQNTTLGWILSGPISSSSSSIPASVATFHCNVSSELDAELRRFWEVEELPSVTRLSPSEQQCEEHFQRSHSRAPSGQYVVRLPFIEGPPIDIGPSLATATNMFLRQENRLRRDAEHYAEFSNFLREYEALGHMVEVKEPSPVPSAQTVYIPYHAVIREHSTTTHLRVVFNASAKTTNGKSLNDHLYRAEIAD